MKGFMKLLKQKNKKSDSNGKIGSNKSNKKLMDKVKIKRVKRDKKKISTKEKVLAGLGLGASLFGAAGVTAPKASSTEITSTNSSQQGTKTSSIKSALNKIFGIPVAEAARTTTVTGYVASTGNTDSTAVSTDTPVSTAASRNSTAVARETPTKSDTTTTTAVTPSLSFTTGSGDTSTPKVGDTWKISITNATPGASVTVIGSYNGGSSGEATTMGAIQSDGTLSLSGTFTADQVGSWQESWSVGGTSVGSFSFNVTGAVVAATVTGLSFSSNSVKQGGNYVATISGTNLDGVSFDAYVTYPDGNGGTTSGWVNNWQTGATQTQTAGTLPVGTYTISKLRINGTTTTFSYGATIKITAAATPSLSFTTSSGNVSTPKVGDTWTITIANAAANTDVYVKGYTTGVSGSQAEGPANAITTKMGTTDANGNFILSGTFTADQIGTWNETWIVGSASGSFAFQVTSATTAAEVAVTGLSFNKTKIKSGDSYNATISGTNLDGVSFDAYVTYPAASGTSSGWVNNWQTGATGTHSDTANLPDGNYTVTKLRVNGTTKEFAGISATMIISSTADTTTGTATGTGTTTSTTTTATTTTAPILYVTGGLGTGTVGKAFSSAFSVTAGDSNTQLASSKYSIAVVSGTLPPGLNLSTAGVISGTPTTAGTYNFSMVATGSGYTSTTLWFTMVISPASATTTATADSAVVTLSSYSLNLQIGATATVKASAIAAGETQPDYNFSVSSNSDAVSASVDSSGNITITANSTTGDTPAVVTVHPQDVATSNTASDETISVTVSGSTVTTASSGGGSALDLSPGFITTSMPNGTIGQLYTAGIRASSYGSVTYSIVSGSLPPGLSLVNQGSYANIDGTPTVAGNYVFTVQATNSYGSTKMQFVINIPGSGSSGTVQASSVDAQLTNLNSSFVGLQMPSGLQMPDGYDSSANTTAVETEVKGVATTGSYTVKKGDTLASIANKVYGDSTKWRKILSANPKCLSVPGNTRTLKVGAVLSIPQL